MCKNVNNSVKWSDDVVNRANVSVFVWQSEINISEIWCHHWAPMMILMVTFPLMAEPSSSSALPHPPPPPHPFTLCVSDTVCYMSRMPECSVPTSAGTGGVWSIPLSAGNRHVRSPPPGAYGGAEGREWVETSSFFFFLSSYLCTNKHGHVLTQGLSMKLLVVCVTSCNKCVIN